MISYSLVILMLILVIVSADPSLTLHTHIWCPPCLKAKSIFSKLNQTYSNLITFKQVEHQNKTVLYRSGSQGKQADILSFPTLIFNCSKTRFVYQNQFTFKEISYWIDSICLHKLIKCTDQINSHLYHIAVKSQNNVQKIVESMRKYPHIRICEAHNANYTHEQAIQILTSVDKQTIFLDYFSNNVRNYLIQSQKLAVALITPHSNSSKAGSFFKVYLGLQNNKVHNENQDTSKLIFLGLCYNANTSKCVASDHRKEQVTSSMKFIPKLMYFLGLDLQLLGQTQFLVAFRFNYPKLQTYIYHHSHGVLDEKFLFWLSDLLKTKKKEEKARYCLWNSLVHRISSNNLQDLETNAFLKSEVQQLNASTPEKIVLTTNVKAFHNQPKFTLCINGSYPIAFQRNKDFETILKIIREKVRTSVSEQL